MKLIDILGLIPEKTDFCVELYDERDEMFYGYMVGPHLGDRSQLEPEHNYQVIDITSGIVRSVNWPDDIPVISIAVRHSLEEELV